MADLQDKLRLFAGNLFPATGEYIIDPVHTFAEFGVQHIMVGLVRGRFDSVSGKIKIAEDPLLSTIEFTADTSTVSTHHKDRDADLRSPRFFDVEKYPTLTFGSTDIKTELKGKLLVEGNLTMHGVTKPVSLDVRFSGIVQDPWGNTRAAFVVKTRINRKDFGLMADLERESGGLPVGKDVKIKVSVEALLKNEGGNRL
jgi:polyisoprenoid-binding protein YceI